MVHKVRIECIRPVKPAHMVLAATRVSLQDSVENLAAMQPMCFLPAGRVRSARPAGPKITSLFLRLYIYIYVRPHLSRTQ